MIKDKILNIKIILKIYFKYFKFLNKFLFYKILYNNFLKTIFKNYYQIKSKLGHAYVFFNIFCIKI